jgi:DNA-binding CsgD family transcriptional regulator/tetratricopeptide (TPR) repeat protein
VAATLGAPPVGRDQELAVLRAAVAALVAGRGGWLWVEGEPGIGKSTLVNEILGEAAARRCQVYRAVGDPFGKRMPLRALTDGLGPDPAADVVALLDSVDASDRLAGVSAVPAAVERLLTVVDQLCVASPVLLAFDDLQWADEASLVAWRRLGMAVHQLPLLLVSASRPVPIRPSLAELRRGALDNGAVLMSLGPLPDGELAGLLGRLAGGVPGPRLRRMVAHAGGNPLYAGELVDALRREGRIQVGGGTAELAGVPDRQPGAVGKPDVEDKEPAALGAAIRDRLGFLSPEATTALRVAALLGPHFSAFDLAMVTGTAITALLAVLDEAVAAGVLAESGNRLQFRHGLIRQALYEATPASARTALHRQVAKVLADAGMPLDEVGAHLAAAAPDALDGWAIDWLARYATRLAYRAPDLAAELLPVAAARAEPDGPHRAALLHGLAQSLDVLNRTDEADAVARQALACSTDPAESAELVWNLATILYLAGRYARSLGVLEDGLARPDLPAPWPPRMRAARAKTLAALGRHDEAAAEGSSAAAEGDRLGDPLTIGTALHALYLVTSFSAGLAHLNRALQAVGHAPETTSLRISLLANRGYALEELGDPVAAEASMREALVLSEQLGTWQLPLMRVQTGRQYLNTGRWDDAWAELVQTSGKFGLFERLIQLGSLALIAAHRDDRATTAQLLREADELPALAGYMRGNATLLLMARAVDAEQRGGPAAAVSVLADTIAVEDISDLYDRYQWLPDLVRLALAAGNVGLARAVVATAEADVADEALPRRVAAARRARAVLDADADTLLALAAEHRADHALLPAGQAYEEAAVLLAQAHDLPGARTALGDAVAAYRELGAAWDIRRADARLRQVGVRRGPRSVRRRPTTGWAALTPTEERVASLVAEGRSNPDIAAELLLSRRTVQTHVSNILNKLGYSSRIEIAREADRHAAPR